MTGYWLIHPDWLPRVQTILRAGQERLPELQSQVLGTRLEAPKLDVRAGGVAVIPVHGVIWSRLTLESEVLSFIYGGTIAEVLGQAVQAAVADPDVRSILLHVDSPGGQAAGIDGVAEVIRAAARRKPLAAHADGLMASAAYWLAAAAGEISASPGSIVGSIGTYAEFDDDSQKREQEGTKLVVARDRHAPAKHADPATPEGLAQWEEVVTDHGDVFRAAVAAYRDVPPAKVLDDFGRGGVMIAAEARKVGLIDRVGSLAEALAKLSGANRARLAKVRPDAPSAVQSTLLTARASVWGGSLGRLVTARTLPTAS